MQREIGSVQMKKATAVVLGLVAFVPLATWPVVLLVSKDSFSTAVITAVALAWIVPIGFIVYLYKGSAVPSEKRGLWLALLLFGNVLALPFFWFWYIWRTSPNPSS